MSDSSVYVDEKLKVTERAISYNDIASKLINDRLLLTALELHTELIEAGKELRILRDFFSNPANFEWQSQELPSLICKLNILFAAHCLVQTIFSSTVW